MSDATEKDRLIAMAKAALEGYGYMVVPPTDKAAQQLSRLQEEHEKLKEKLDVVEQREYDAELVVDKIDTEAYNALKDLRRDASDCSDLACRVAALIGTAKEYQAEAKQLGTELFASKLREDDLARRLSMLLEAVDGILASRAPLHPEYASSWRAISNEDEARLRHYADVCRKSNVEE